jgi:hypothetical protein
MTQDPDDCRLDLKQWPAEGPHLLWVTYADGHLYLHDELGDVGLVEANPDAFREKGRLTPPGQPKGKTAGSFTERAFAFPVIANGRLYIRDLGTLWAHDIRQAVRAPVSHDARLT